MGTTKILVTEFQRHSSPGYSELYKENLSHATLTNICLILEIPLKALSSIGWNSKLFGLHSLRSGEATSAASSGVNGRLLKVHENQIFQGTIMLKILFQSK